MWVGEIVDVGPLVGLELGTEVGGELAIFVGFTVGAALGALVGRDVGSVLGAPDARASDNVSPTEISEVSIPVKSISTIVPGPAGFGCIELNVAVLPLETSNKTPTCNIP